MKKYIQPETTTIEVKVESMLQSISFGTGTVDPGESLEPGPEEDEE